MQYTLGVDIGTYQAKGVLVDSTGLIVATATRSHRMIVPQPGWAEHRAVDDWWDGFVFLARKLLADSAVNPGDIKAIACSAIGPCMLPVDSAGIPLMNAVLYGVDQRAEAEVAELTQRIGEATILEHCGNALTSQSVGPKILWLKRHRPDLFANTARVLTSSSYLVYRLTGEYVIDHYTAANFSPIYDVNTLDWSDALADDIIQLERLPRLAWSGDIVGAITTDAAAQTGLAPGTPVTAGTIDAAAEALSVGVTGTGDMMLMYGSTIFIVMLTGARVRDARLWYAPWLFEGQHASLAGLATSGTLTHWFRDQLARDLEPDDAIIELSRGAQASPPGANGLLFLPYFSGERTPIHDPRAKGCLFGLNLTHTRDDMFRAVLEGIACGTQHVLETYAEVGSAPSRVLAVGGGTNNAAWAQATSDIAGVDQLVCDKTIGASYGDAFLAAHAIGDVALHDINHWNPIARTIKANKTAAHDKQYALFRRLYEQTRDIAGELDESRR